MKRFSMFAAASCLGIALALTPGAAAQQEGGQQPTPAAPAPSDQGAPPSGAQSAPPSGTQGAAPPPSAGAPQARKKHLPRTASPMPLVGLTGMLSLAAAGLMRRFRKFAA